MSIYSIKYRSNVDVSDKSTIKLYLITGVVFISVAFLPTLIF